MQKKVIFEFNENQANEFLELLQELRSIIRKTDNNEPKFINIDQFCQRYNMKKNQVYQLTSKGKIPGMRRNGKHIFFIVSETDKWMENQNHYSHGK